MVIKWQQMWDAGVGLVRNPWSFTDQMKFFEARQEWPILHWAYERMVDELSPEQAERLKELTFRGTDLDELAKLPEGTFGRAYVDFFRRQNVKATGYMDAWPAMAKVVERSWIVRRSLKLHDMHHVLLGFPCDPPGEWGITAFTVRNNREPNHAVALVGFPAVALLYGDVRSAVTNIVHGWKLAGLVDQNLFYVPLEDMFELQLDEVRRRCGIPLEEVSPVPRALRSQSATCPMTNRSHQAN